MRRRIVGFLGSSGDNGGGGPTTPTDYYRTFGGNNTSAYVTTMPSGVLTGAYDFAYHLLVYIASDYDFDDLFIGRYVLSDSANSPSTGKALLTLWLGNDNSSDAMEVILKSSSSGSTEMNHTWSVYPSPGQWHHLVLRGDSADAQFKFSLRPLGGVGTTNSRAGAMPYSLDTAATGGTIAVGAADRDTNDSMMSAAPRLYVGVGVGADEDYLNSFGLPGNKLVGLIAHSALTTPQKLGLRIAVEGVEGIPQFGSEFSDLSGYNSTTGGDANYLAGALLKTFTSSDDFNPATPVTGLAPSMYFPVAGQIVYYARSSFPFWDYVNRATGSHSLFVRFSSLTGQRKILTVECSNRDLTFTKLSGGAIQISGFSGNINVSTAPVVADEWTHICATIRVVDVGADVREYINIYVNGVNIHTSQDLEGSSTQIDDSVTIGDAANTTDDGMAIAGLRIHPTFEWDVEEVNSNFYIDPVSSTLHMAAYNALPSILKSYSTVNQTSSTYTEVMAVAAELVTGFPVVGDEIISITAPANKVAPVVSGGPTLTGPDIPVYTNINDLSSPDPVDGTYKMAWTQQQYAAHNALVDGDAEWSFMIWTYNEDTVSGTAIQETLGNGTGWSIGVTNAGGGSYRYTAEFTQSNATTINITSTNSYSTTVPVLNQVVITYSLTDNVATLYVNGGSEGTAAVTHAMQSLDSLTSAPLHTGDITQLSALRKWNIALSAASVGSYRVYNDALSRYDVLATYAFTPEQLTGLEFAVELASGMPALRFELQDQAGSNHFDAGADFEISGADIGFTTVVPDTLVVSLSGAGALVADTNITSTTTFTVNVWAKLTSTATNQAILTLDDPDDVGNRGAALYFDAPTSTLVARVVTTGGTDTIAIPFNDTANTHMITLTHDSANRMELYVDAINVGSTDATGGISATGLDVTLGAFSGATPDYMNGELSMAYFSTTVWSAYEVVANYNAGAGIPVFDSMSQVVYDDAAFFWSAMVYVTAPGDALTEQVNGVANLSEVGAVGYNSTADPYEGTRLVAAVPGNRVRESGDNAVTEDSNNRVDE